jgi:ribosome biogenesis protein MAK21
MESNDELRGEVGAMLSAFGDLLEKSKPKDAKEPKGKGEEGPTSSASTKPVKKVTPAVAEAAAEGEKLSKKVRRAAKAAKAAEAAKAKSPGGPAAAAPAAAPVARATKSAAPAPGPAVVKAVPAAPAQRLAAPKPAAPAPPAAPARKYNKAGPFMIAVEKEEKEASVFGLTPGGGAISAPAIDALERRGAVVTAKGGAVPKAKDQAVGRVVEPVPLALTPDYAALSAARMTGALASGEGGWFAQTPPIVAAAPAAHAPGGKRKRAEDVPPPAQGRVSLVVLERLKALAAVLLAAETAAHEAKVGKGGAGAGDEVWMRSVLTGGTAGDKLAALTLLIARHPLHTGKHLDTLLTLAGKKSRRESQSAMNVLKDLFVTNLLPEDRRLTPFISKARAGQAAALLQAGHLSPAHLVFWEFEDALARRYAAFITTLTSHAGDGIVHFKLHALATAAELLVARPEGEAALLCMLSHKLGDKESKVASRAVHLLLKTADAHPAMAPVLVQEVQQRVLDPAAPPSTQYAGVTFLNQLPLVRDDPAHAALATRLVTCYFALFEAAVGDGRLEARLLSALLTGVNRAVPYAPNDAASTAALEARADAMFTVVHKGTFATAVQALTVLQHVAARKMGAVVAGAAPDTFVDRFYRALYGMLDPSTLGSSGKHALFLNLLYKSLKADAHVPRARALIKRLAGTALHMPPPFAAGAVLLIGEVLAARPELRAIVTVPEGTAAGAGGDDEMSEAPPANDAVAERERALALLDSVLGDEGGQEEEDVPAPAALPAHPVAPTTYDASKREPKYAGAEGTCLWELAPLAAHFHPSVRTFADAVMSHAATGGREKYSGDPLTDFTTMAFLDRLAYKNPKKRVVAAFGSQEDRAREGVLVPAAPLDELAAGYAALQGTDTDAQRLVVSGRVRGASLMQRKGARHGRTGTAAPANSRAFADSDPRSVAAEDAFMHAYFAGRAAHGKGAAAASEPAEGEDDGASDAGSEESVFAQGLAESLMREADPDADLGDFEDGFEEDEGEDEEEGVRGELDDGEEGDGRGLEEEDGGFESEEEEEAEVEEEAKKPAPRESVFASADDYADVLASDDEEGGESEGESEERPGQGTKRRRQAESEDEEEDDLHGDDAKPKRGGGAGRGGRGRGGRGRGGPGRGGKRGKRN